MSASEIRRLARRAGIGPGTAVLDLCCGVAGPGRLIAAERACRYLGVDYSASAVEIARRLAGDLPCRFEQTHVPPLPQGRFDVVLLLETMLAFADKRALLSQVACALPPGGRFACTVEEGRPLSSHEWVAMPDPDTVWLIELSELMALLDEVGLPATWWHECTASHQAMATTMLQSFHNHAEAIARRIGTKALDELIAAHQLWSDWLRTGRVRKFALVATRR